MAADLVKLAEVERVLSIGDAVSVWPRLDFSSCLFLVVDGSPVDTIEVKMEGSRTRSLLW